MALYSIKKIEGPGPSVGEGLVSLRITIIDKETGTQTVIGKVISEVSGGYDVPGLLAQLDEDYTQNDFDV